MEPNVFRSWVLPSKDFVCARKSFTTDDQPHDQLLAVGPMVAGVASLGFGNESGFAFEVGAGQVVEQDCVSQVEEALFPLA
jgi:hypothetical protein